MSFWLCTKSHIILAKRVATFGTWNVRTLYAAVLVKELERLRWDVIGLAETHWTGAQEYWVQGYKIINSGRENEHRAGVGLILSKLAQRALMSHRPVNDRILSARFKTATGAVTICQVYAPTAEAEDESIDAFYNDLQQEMNEILRGDIIVLMGNFNAKVGTGSEETKGIMGTHGIGGINERGERLLDFCCMNNLMITNTRFKQAKASRKWSW